MRQLVCAVFATAAIGLATTAAAADIGPRSAIGAIRHDLPILLKMPLQRVRQVPTVDWVVADRQRAVAKWHAGHNQGIVALRFISGKWWWQRAAATIGDDHAWSAMASPGTEVSGCDAMGKPPSARLLLNLGDVGQSLATKLSPLLARIPFAKSPILELCEPDANAIQSNLGPYSAALSFRWTNYSPWPIVLSGDAPKLDGPPADLQSIAYYRFEMQVRRGWSASRPIPDVIRFLDAQFVVWFPYVISKRPHYVLSMDAGDSSLGRIPGVVRNNQLQFEVPWFAWKSHSIAVGEISARRI